MIRAALCAVLMMGLWGAVPAFAQDGTAAPETRSAPTLPPAVLAAEADEADIPDGSAPPSAAAPGFADAVPVAVDPQDSAAADDAEAEAEPAIADPGFLIPIDGDVFHDPDLRVLVSLPGAPPAGMVLLIDGYPENAPLKIEDGLLSIKLSGLKAGVHTLSLLLFNERTEIVSRAAVRFFIRIPEPKREPRKGSFRQFGRFVTKLDWKGREGEGRILSQSELKLADDDSTLEAGKEEKPLSQEVEGVAEATYNVKYKQFQAYGKALVRTDENRFRQPAHRLSATAKYGPWASIRGGDVYPSYNPLILSGTRVRGAEAGLSLTVGDRQFGSFKIVTGESKREVPAYVARYDTGGAEPRVDTIPGTFAQELIAGRLGFGGGQHFDLGFTFLKAKDQISSGREMALNRRLNGVRPVDNLVNGVDMRAGFWDGRIQVYGEYATSLFTKDHSLGVFATDSFDITVDPEDYEDWFIFNATTRGWQYLVISETSGTEEDVAGFINTNSAYNLGFVSSIPIPGLVMETEFRYSHLGLEYHSEGNPFLGGNPGEGFTFIQRLAVLDNRLNLGLELGKFNQDLGFLLQEQRTAKAEVRFMPGPYTPSFVLGGGLASIAPVGDYAHQYSSRFASLNTGAYHQFQMPESKLDLTFVYGFTQDEFEIESTDPDVQPESVNRTHIFNTSGLYKVRNAEFIPKANYSFAYNGIQEPTHTVGMGFLQFMAKNALKLDVMGTIGQYPRNNEKNDVSMGQAVTMDYTIAPGQTLRIREKWMQYGDQQSVLLGANYELYF